MQKLFQWVLARCKIGDLQAEDRQRDRETLAHHTELRIRQSFKNAQTFVELRRTKVFEEAQLLGRRPSAEESGQLAVQAEETEEPPSKRLSLEEADQRYRERVAGTGL